MAAVSKTRKGSEGLLVCRSAPLSRKLDTSPLPGRPRKVRRLDEIFDADDSFSLKWVFRGSPKYLAGYYLSLASILMRCTDEYFEEAANLIDAAADIVDNEPEYSENRCYLCMVSAWYSTLVLPNVERTKAFTDKAAEIAHKVFPTDLEIIDIINIPTANCWFYHNDMGAAVAELEKAVEICRKYTDSLPYIDKQAELLNCLLDVYYEVQNMSKCSELIAEIDRINDEYKEQGMAIP